MPRARKDGTPAAPLKMTFECIDCGRGRLWVPAGRSGPAALCQCRVVSQFEMRDATSPRR
jgi:hypothetical protein